MTPVADLATNLVEIEPLQLLRPAAVGSKLLRSLLGRRSPSVCGRLSVRGCSVTGIGRPAFQRESDGAHFGAGTRGRHQSGFIAKRRDGVTIILGTLSREGHVPAVCFADRRRQLISDPISVDQASAMLCLTSDGSGLIVRRDLAGRLHSGV